MTADLEWKLIDLATALTRSEVRGDGEKARRLIEWFAPPSESHFRGTCAHTVYEAALRLESEEGPGPKVLALYQLAMEYGHDAAPSIVTGAHHRSGICHEHAGRYMEAMEEYFIVLSDADTWPAATLDARERLAGLLVHAERWEEALSQLRLLDREPEGNLDLAMERGMSIARCCLATRRFDEGLAKLDGCLLKVPEERTAELLLLKSELAEKAGRLDEAQSCLETALARVQDWPALRLAILARLSILSSGRHRK